MNSPSSGTSINANVGFYGQYRQELKDESAESIKYIFDLQQVTLLSDDMLRIQIKVEEELIDTTIMYTIVDEQLVSEALAGTNIISYDEAEQPFTSVTETV